MSDILPKPFTKDGLLGMLEKHLTHMKHMQELGGYVIPAPMKTEQQRLVELPEQQNSTSQQQQQQESVPLGTPLDEEPPFQFSYDQDYSAIFGNGSPTQLPPQHQNIPTSTGKRRTASERDQYEYLEQGRGVPRSTGGEGAAPGKRVRYNTPPW